MIVYAEDVKELSVIIEDYIDGCEVADLPQLASVLNAYAQVALAEHEECLGDNDAGC